MYNTQTMIKTQSLNIGGYELKALPTGKFGLDGGAMFGTVPKVLWERTNPADDKNRIEMEARALLLVGHNRKILVDTGNGSDFIEKYGEKAGTKFAEMYAVDPNSGLLKALQKHGLKAEDITDVILTHLHFDHAGGATCARNGKIVPTFPNAKYYVQKNNLETARNPNLREKASYLKPNFEPLIEAGVLELLDGDKKNFFPNISLRLMHGHTSFQQLVEVSDSTNGLIYGADLIATSTHMRLAWVMGYDLNPLVVIEEKQKLLKEAFDKGWYIYFEHDPYCDYASVEFDSAVGREDFKAKERFSLPTGL